MGKKRVTYDFNDPKPPNNNNVVIDHHHHHHRHHNHQKSKKIKPEAKLLHTLNSHLKKLAKSRSRNTLSHPPPPPATVTTENNKNHHGNFSLLLNHDHHRCHRRDWFTGLDSDHEDAHDDHDGGGMRVFEFGQEFCWKTTSSCENNEDLFGGDCVFAPDLNVSPNLVVVFEEDGSGCGSYIPDPVMNLDNGDDGNYLYDILELSSQEDMINEFLKVNLFVS
ncbi:hypothetical protein L6452_10439 [Arctium lappa]|uniref:Uncharacterized protein n=1 Tax=Arctium lappa TaxID=4217 RepID=A0ACB9DMW6_ARCLA|nr:hypothetical protein L6452_10439 [Arctium lappa]